MKNNKWISKIKNPIYDIVEIFFVVADIIPWS